MTHENLKGRVAVVTGGGGVLCGQFAKTLAKQGCKVAVLDLNEAAAQACADEIVANGGEAIAVGCNVLDSESMQNARKIINEKLGTCDILLNGAGGNNPKGTTTKDTLEQIDLVQKDETIDNTLWRSYRVLSGAGSFYFKEDDKNDGTYRSFKTDEYSKQNQSSGRRDMNFYLDKLHGELLSGFVTQVLPALIKGISLHDSSVAAAIRIVIDLLLFV